MMIKIQIRKQRIFPQKINCKQTTQQKILNMDINYIIYILNGDWQFGQYLKLAIQIKVEIYCYKLNRMFSKNHPLTSQDICQLPPRPKGRQLSRYQESKLVSNLYKVDFDSGLVISIHSVKINPHISLDSTKKVNLLIESARSALSPYIGANFIICGRTLYSCQRGSIKKLKESCTVSTRNGNQTYSICVQFVREVQMSKINSKCFRQSCLPLNFMNHLMKSFFLESGFVEVGKAQKYFDPKSRQSISNNKIVIFNGYETSFNLLENGLYLRVDSMTRILQNKTVLEHINELYSKNNNLSKQEKRNIVKEDLIGKIVVGNYGNTKHWIVEDVDFDTDFYSTCLSLHEKTTIAQYYERNYGMQIRNKRQPAIRSSSGSKKNTTSVILIPQFLLLSGLPDNFDERQRRQISEHTIVNPQEKLKRIKSLISLFNQKGQSCTLNSVSRSLGVKIAQKNQQVKATILPSPKLQLGNGDIIQENRVSSFSLYNKPLYRNDVPVTVQAYIPQNFDFDQVEKLFASTCKNLAIKYTIKKICINYSNERRAIKEIETIMMDQDGTYDEYDLNWFIIPPGFKGYYADIKKISVREKNPKVTQVTLLSTLKKKNFSSIITKILLQIATKVGNVPWVPEIQKPKASRIMIVGIQTGKDAKSNSLIIGYCGNLNENMSQFHSNYLFDTLKVGKSKICEVISDCLNAYGKFNGSLPTDIIVLKNGCSNSEIETLLSCEVEEIKNTFKEISKYSPKLVYILADKNPKQKFFLEKNHQTVNPCYGTLINSKVTGKGYQFYLVSQNCNRGTAKPVHYKIIYNDSDFEEGVLEELLYAESFNYMNWSGAIRVPSALQYAEKLVKFAHQNLKKPSETDQLNNYLFYI